MRLVSRLAPPAAVAALAAALASPGTAHAAERMCMHSEYQMTHSLRYAVDAAAVGNWASFQWWMDQAYEEAGGYC
jgi:hypothetical protein